MWICMKNAFLSAVQDLNDSSRLCVRARDSAHLKRLFPLERVVETADADYAARVFIDKREFGARMLQLVSDINYTNFKNSVTDDDLHELYVSFWRLHRGFQERLARKDDHRLP